MPLNKLDNFLKNVEGRILYVSPSDLDASDAITNQGNSQTTPFKTIQRALIESARFSYVPGNNNDITEKTTILLMPGEHIIDNRPGYQIKQDENIAGQVEVYSPTGAGVKETDGVAQLTLNLDSQFDLNQRDNILFKFNSTKGGVIVPRGTSLVGLDLRKTKIRPKYVPNPTKDSVPESAIFRITGACYFWQFSIFDGRLSEKVYVDNLNFEDVNFVKPSFSHHKLTCFEYADGVNKDDFTNLTDLDMYYHKLSIAYDNATERDISEKFPDNPDGFISKRPEFEIVGAFAPDPIKISNIISGDGTVASRKITVTTETDHNLDVDTPIRIRGVGESGYNVSTNVTRIDETNPRIFEYSLSKFDSELKADEVDVSEAQVVVETDTVNGASPYIFNISLRSVFGMNGMHADGSKATGFRSMVVAQFTGVSLQKDDRAFVKYQPESRDYSKIAYQERNGDPLASESSASSSDKIFHLDSQAIYRSGWETRHVKISNDAILQIVSVFAIGYNTHFEGQSGADASITNSNSNFGQLALVSDGFKKDAFAKDDRAFITHIIPPRAITSNEENIDWVAIDIDKTKTYATSNGNSRRLYLFGFTSEDIKPPALTQGFRIGAKTNDLLFVNIDGVEKSAKILMGNQATLPSKSGVKEINIINQANGVFTSSGAHNLSEGEKVILISDDADLPENIDEKTVYFVIDKDENNTVSTNKFKLASSLTNANNNDFIKAYFGSNLKLLSRVTDKDSGDINHPVQWDGSQYYINVPDNNDIYNAISSLSSDRTDPSFVKRISDTRSLDEKIYKLRLAIPKEIINSKNPENGFVIQESTSTGVRSIDDFNKLNDLTTNDYLFDRNPRFISTCKFTGTGNIVEIGLEKPHNLNVGDIVRIKNIKDTIKNPTGIDNSGYNGEFAVTEVPNSMSFKYTTGNVTVSVGANNNFNDKTTLQYPRYERIDLKSNIYIFRNNIISEFVNDNSDGVYQVFALNSSNPIPLEFENLKYSQNVVDVYPQLDRDNINENPPAAKTFALRSPLGQVNTNDPLKSITRETTDKLLKKIGVGLEIQSYDSATGVVSFTSDHNIAGIMTGTRTQGSGYTNGTYFNVKVYTSESTQNDTTWNGTLAKVVVSGAHVSSFDITNPGSDMLGKIGYFDNAALGGGSGAKITNTGLGLKSNNVGISTDLILQTTGIGVTSDSYFRIIGTNGTRQVSIAKTTGDIPPQVGQYGLLVGTSSKISSTVFNPVEKITFVTTSSPHGLVAGNRFQLNDATNNNQGTFIVKSKNSVTNFTFETSSTIAVANGHILKHGLSANDGLSGKGNENLSVRGVELFDKETAIMTSSEMAKDDEKVSVMLLGVLERTNLIKRFPYGSYILIDQEIMRVKSRTLGGSSSNEISVIRGVFGTTVSSHSGSSLVKSIKAFPIQFNRPSILRASGHTFEYLGYGPGNYSTALPQVQVKTISEREEFLSQSQERSGGAVVYTGMNNKGDFYIGNQKKSALTGEETSFDTPIPSVAGEDPGRLSVVFDEVTVKDRIVVEGGKSKTVLSEFDGPTTFNNEVQFKDAVKIKTETESTSPSTGALLIFGGVGFAKTAHFADDAALKFGTDGDLEISHETNEDPDANVVRSKTSGGKHRNLFLQSNDRVIISNTTASCPSAIFNTGVGAGVTLMHNCTTRLETISDGVRVSGIVTATGEMYATTFNGSGAGLTDLNQSQLIDSSGTVRVEANTSGALFTGISTSSGVLVGKKALLLDGSDSDSGDIRSAGGNDGIAVFQNTTNNGQWRIATRNSNGADQTLAQFKLINEQPKVELGNLDINGELRVTGDIIAFYTSSDQNLKDNISPIKKALDKVKSISGNTFTWNHIHPDYHGDDVGVIAQELESLGLPGIVKNKESGYKSVQYHKIIPILIEAIKELSDKVDALENK